eukprot:10691469-Karenia_brevis.AAC.1
MPDPWTINRGTLPPLSILSENRATMRKAFGLAANQMLGHGVAKSSHGHGRLDMVGIDKNSPIDRVATRVLLDGVAFTPAIGVALLKAKNIIQHGQPCGDETQQYLHALPKHVEVLDRRQRADLET